MADTKISALTAATTPLAGTEVLPIVQNGVTKQVSVANLTAGRAVSADSMTQNVNYTSARAASAPTYGGNYYIYSGSGLNASVGGVEWQYATAGAGYGFKMNVNGGPDALEIGYRANSATWTVGWQFKNDGNMVPAVAAKGINFAANTPAAGMTSQLLNWYEEGTWTPDQGAGLTVVGAFSSSGKYTRIGRQVTVQGSVAGATSVAIAATATQICTNLPFSSSPAYSGSMFNASVAGFGGVASSGTIVYATSTMGATTSITFSITYTI
jgi:hypothetical protein